MKKVLTIVGMVASTLTTIGAVMKIMHWPGANICLIIGISLFSCCFIPVYGYNLFYELSGRKSKIGSIIGTFAFCLVALHILFKMLHWPGASIMMIIGFGSLSLYIFPMLMIFKLAGVSGIKEKVFHASWYISISFLILGYMFKLLHWPAANLLFLTGVLVLSFGYFPFAIKFYNNDEHRKKLYARFLLVPFSIIIITSIFLNISKEILNVFGLVDDGINKTSTFLKEKSEAYYSKCEEPFFKNSVYYPKAMKVKDLSDEIYNYIENMKEKLIVSTEGKSEVVIESRSGKDTIVKLSSNVLYLEVKDDAATPSEILIGDAENPHKGAWSAIELKAKMFVYRQDMLSMYEGEMKELAGKTLGLTTEDLYSQREGTVTSWENYFFHWMPIICDLTILSKIQSDIRYTESTTIEYLYNRAEKEMNSK